jgi:hypothetical protein
MLQTFLKTKKAMMGMHTFGGLDIVIVLVGVIIGIALVWYGIQQGWMPQDIFCPPPAVAP